MITKLKKHQSQKMQSPSSTDLPIPYHIAIIPDGNRRWAKKHNRRIIEGYRRGADTAMDTVLAAKELGVKVITFFTFSTENWKRPKEEVEALMTLLQTYLTEKCPSMQRNGIKFDTIGDQKVLPRGVKNAIEKTKQATQECSSITLVLAINYGSRNEICRAFRSMLDDYSNDRLNKDDIDEETISNYLDTCHWKDPDLLIRTSAEMRVSNFLLWQISYAEIHISNVLWPDFTKQDLLEAAQDYQFRKRRLGGQ